VGKSFEQSNERGGAGIQQDPGRAASWSDTAPFTEEDRDVLL